MFSQITLVTFVCAIVDNVANCHVDHPNNPKPSTPKATRKKVFVSSSSTQNRGVDKRS
jgi:hypothetical protein